MKFRYLVIASLFITTTAYGKIIKFANTSKPNHLGLRISSYPHITGDTFRAICDHIIDETQNQFDTDTVKPGNIIFIKTSFCHPFFKAIHPFITNPYILVTHNDDLDAPGDFYNFLQDKKIIAWFGINCNIENHQKFIPIPIGVANKNWYFGDPKDIDIVRQHLGNYKRTNLVYLNVSKRSNKSRKDVLQLFTNKSWCTTSTPTKSHQEYLEAMAQSKFVLSPRGAGEDCYRTWEAMLMGAIPIVKHSKIDPIFEGLPVLLINDWHEISEHFLHRTYTEMQNKHYNLERLFAPYWLQKITGVKNNFLQKQTCNSSIQ